MFKTVAGFILGAVGLVVVLGIFFFHEKTTIERSLVDAQTYCPLTVSKSVWGLYDVQPPKVDRRTAVVVDATDQIPETQRKRIAEWFEKDFTESLVRFEKVAIYELRPRRDSSGPMLNEPQFDRCAPPATANKWIENPRLVRANFEQQFMKEKLSVIDALASQDEARWSPIMEILEILYGDYHRIVLVSDLMQNTPDCSLYQRRDNGEYSEGCLEFSGISLDNRRLEVVLVERSKLVSLQDGVLKAFWRNHMEERRGAFSLETQVANSE